MINREWLNHSLFSVQSQMIELCLNEWGSKFWIWRSLIKNALLLISSWLKQGAVSSSISPVTNCCAERDIPVIFTAAVQAVLGIAAENNMVPTRGDFFSLYNFSCWWLWKRNCTGGIRVPSSAPIASHEVEDVFIFFKTRGKLFSRHLEQARVIYILPTTWDNREDSKM